MTLWSNISTILGVPEELATVRNGHRYLNNRTA